MGEEGEEAAEMEYRETAEGNSTVEFEKGQAEDTAHLEAPTLSMVLMEMTGDVDAFKRRIAEEENRGRRMRRQRRQ